jgi:hypothetical protein
MRNKKSVPFISKPTVAIIVDGETEFWYLQMIKRNERRIKVDIKPEIPQRKKLEDQYAKVVKLSAIYDKVFWIVDLDVILVETAKAKEKGEKAIDKFLRYRDNFEKEHKNITVIINQPCLEFWLLIHFQHTTKCFSSCQGAQKLLEKYLLDYCKSEQYFLKQNNDIYLKLKPRLNDAIGNSKKLKSFDKDNLYNGFTEMHKLFEALGIE